MRRHIYIGVTDARRTWLENRITEYDIIEFYGQKFHIMFAPEKLGNYHVVEITNYDIKFSMKRLYRYLTRQKDEGKLNGIVGPMTLKQLFTAYPTYVRRWFTDGTSDEAGNWAPGTNIVPMRQIAGDPDPIEQAKFEYEPDAAEVLLDKITNAEGEEILDDVEPKPKPEPEPEISAAADRVTRLPS